MTRSKEWRVSLASPAKNHSLATIDVSCWDYWELAKISLGILHKAGHSFSQNWFVAYWHILAFVMSFHCTILPCMSRWFKKHLVQNGIEDSFLYRTHKWYRSSLPWTSFNREQQQTLWWCSRSSRAMGWKVNVLGFLSTSWSILMDSVFWYRLFFWLLEWQSIDWKITLKLMILSFVM